MGNNLNDLLEDLTDQFDPSDIETNKSIAAVACIPLLFWIPLVTASKDSPFAKFYANQGLILLCLCVALNIVNTILGAILGLIPILGVILALIISLVCGVAQIAAFLYELVSALNGTAKPIPVVGKLFEAFK